MSLMMSLWWLTPLLAALPWLARSSPQRVKALPEIPAVIRHDAERLPIVVVMELLVAALSTGVSIPRALSGVGLAIGGFEGTAYLRAAKQLELGAHWEEVWEGASGGLRLVANALRPAWEEGAAPTDSLRATGEAERQRQRAAAKLAAARLGVRLVLPLGLCLLPAFVLIGLVPIMISLGSLLVLN
ncbi:MAG: type II secretion system F family protein [Promicromonosporaceae bacterium]|nr:type II secretion system F family protein [Promicromonosporaceae bacterium]